VDATRLTAAHREDAVATLTAAFWDYPESTHLLPDAGRRRRVLPAYLRSDCRSALRHGSLWGVVDGGSVIGAAAWIPPGAYPVSAVEQLRQAVHLAPIAPWGLGALREARRGQAANRAAHRRDPHWWLQTLGIHPDHQQQGLGTALLAPILRRADTDGVGCYLSTATAANAAWYERSGFTVLSTYRPTAGWPQVWAMWRDPDPAG
jgi:GNAT superfamily N-acetyltransferase